MMEAHRIHGIGRREVLMVTSGLALGALFAGPVRAAIVPASVDLARVASVSGSHIAVAEHIRHLRSPELPRSSRDPGAFEGPWKGGAIWLEYRWDKPVTIDAAELYLWGNGWSGESETAYGFSWWDGARFVPVANSSGLGKDRDRFNRTNFDPVTTTRLRLDMTSKPGKRLGVLRWRVWSAGAVPAFPPRVVAGVDRTVVVGGNTWLAGTAARLIDTPANGLRWRKLSGPGEVRFADPTAAHTTATVSRPGDYLLELTATGEGGTSRDLLRLTAALPPPPERLDVVYTTPYSIDSPFWNARAKALINNWIPHCIHYCERTDLGKKEGEGGIDNFIEAAKALRGEPHGRHRGFVFSNAWVHQTVESMCIALMVDARGDPEILAAQRQMRETLERWIPIILAAQHPDGYLQTAYTLADRKDWSERWSPEHRADHEGYVAGYFIESAINHYTLTGGKDLRLYDAAKKLADCWVANIGPGKKAWYDGHQEMEQALVRFGRFVNDMEGGGRGTPYIDLARFLIESRKGGGFYDQSHLPTVQQYEALGHAVRAVYFYSAMADIAAETGDHDYQSAVLSLWDNMVNRKYYVTGGVGSGDTDEGFGDDYALKNDAYCESCSSCGLIFFQYKLNLAYHDAKYADLYEETMYNALLGAVDLEGRNYTYTNPLVGSERYAWHDCPCCVGNIPRTLLMVPTWTYAKDADGIFVNLFIGSTIDVGSVGGTTVEMVQKTNYPWDGAVSIIVNPKEEAEFAIHVRVPDRKTSVLYSATPAASGIEDLRVNGAPVRARIVNGYAVLRRRWRAGDRIDFSLPLPVQRVTPDPKITQTRGHVALRRGPLVYNVELADQPRLDLPIGAAALRADWRPDLLGGVVAIEGEWRDGSPLTAIPNYARMNRAGPSPEFPRDWQGPVSSRVWIKA